MEHSADVLPLARIQLERVFVAMLIAEDAERFLPLYRKNAWKTRATRFLRDKAELGHLDRYRPFYFETGARQLAEHAQLSGVTTAERDALYARVEQGEREPKPLKIPDMPKREPGGRLPLRQFLGHDGARLQVAHGRDPLR